MEIFSRLNENFRFADELEIDELEKVLKLSEEAYFNSIDGTILLEDKVYDYVREVYQSRQKVPASTSLAHVPKPIGRLLPLPIWMGSMDKVNYGTGQLEAWMTKYRGPYLISAKLDGASAVYFIEDGEYKLYSRGEGDKGQDLSELLEHLDLPELRENEIIRGELIMKKSVFAKKWSQDYRNPRNAVSGLVNRIGSRAVSSKRNEPLNLDFIGDVAFLAYEYVNRSLTQQNTASSQFRKLVRRFEKNIAHHRLVEKVDDEMLSSLFEEFGEIDYEIDGLVLTNDERYERPDEGNPPYSCAFKKPLQSLTKISTVRKIEWSVSKDGYIKPTLIFDPIDVGGVRIERATAYNAKYVLDNVLGPGSVIEITRSGGVIPKVVNFITSAEKPSFPDDVSFKWNETGVDIIFDEGKSSRSSNYSSCLDDEMKRDIDIKRLHFFLTSIGAKGIGEITMGKMYDQGIRDIKALINLKSSEISFLGSKLPDKIVESIRESVNSRLTLPVLMTGSGIFGRGLGNLRFEALCEKYPDLLTRPEVINNNIPEMIELFSQVEGFAEVYASQTARRFQRFISFYNELDIKLVKAKSIKNEAICEGNNGELRGKNVVLSGFRDSEINSLISSLGGKVQTSVNGKTNLLIIKDSNSESSKVVAARASGIKIMTKDFFYRRYLSN